MNEQFHSIVIGLGAMGSAALYQLSKRDLKVLGIDHLSPPHTLGSTHGDTRITRQAIGEGEHYTPFSLRSYEIFREVQKQAHCEILTVTGGLVISSEHDKATINHAASFFENTLSAAKRYGIRHDVLSAKDIRNRFPQFNVSDDEMGYYEYEGAFLRPELAVRSQIDLAVANGATLHTGEKMLRFEEHADSVTLYTDQNQYEAEHLILSMGPWLPETFPELAPIFKVHRQVLYWFDVSSFADFTPGRFPIFIWEIKGAENGIYGFPAIDGPAGGFKIATEDYTNSVTLDSVFRDVSVEETIEMFEHKVTPFFPQAKLNCVKSAVCLYTVTPDSGFVIDWLPTSKRVVVCSPCSGHGFKHSAAIGECLAELVSAGDTTLDISALKLSRFTAQCSSEN